MVEGREKEIGGKRGRKEGKGRGRGRRGKQEGRGRGVG